MYISIIYRSAIHTQAKNGRAFINKLYDEDPITSHNAFITSKDLLSFARQVAKGMVSTYNHLS